MAVAAFAINMRKLLLDWFKVLIAQGNNLITLIEADTFSILDSQFCAITHRLVCKFLKPVYISYTANPYFDYCTFTRYLNDN